MATESMKPTGFGRVPYETGFLPFEFFKNVSWGAIFAGTFVAIAVDLTLNLLGLGVGLGVINPATDQNPFGGITLGAGLWIGISGLIAMFLGGVVAGRLAGFPRFWIGFLHGIVVWGLATLISFYLMTTALGGLIGGVTGIIGKGLSLVGPQAARQATQQAQQPGTTLNNIMNQARQLLSAKGATMDPRIQDAVKRLFSGQVPSAADRNALVNALVARTKMSRPEATQAVNNWIQQFFQTRAQVLTTTDQALSAMSKAAIWVFVAIVLGAICAALGGAAGSPRELITSPSGGLRK